MKNIYDIRREEKLLYILEADNATKKETLMNCAVIVNLYYEDMVIGYVPYIDNIPYGIPAYIYSSDISVLECVKRNVQKKDVFFCKKENRGRDISALLVAAADVTRKYDVICFIHDKKQNQEYLKQDVERWNYNLWENTLASSDYIYNVLDVFEENQDIGLLAPPELLGEFYSDYYDDSWGLDFENTKSLAEQLGIEADISRDKEVFIIGTVFWARTDALVKLLGKKWVYEDFPNEPLPIDGTISHAIEKILGYVAQDAGYKSGTVMTVEYASWNLLNAQKYMSTMFYQIKKRECVFNMHQIINLDEREKNIEEFCCKYEKIYIYGAGNYGVNLSNFMKKHNWKLDGFVVGSNRRMDDFVSGLEVFEIQELEPSEKIGIIIGVSYEYRDEIEGTLKKYKFSNYIYGY